MQISKRHPLVLHGEFPLLFFSLSTRKWKRPEHARVTWPLFTCLMRNLVAAFLLGSPQHGPGLELGRAPASGLVCARVSCGCFFKRSRKVAPSLWISECTLTAVVAYLRTQELLCPPSTRMSGIYWRCAILRVHSLSAICYVALLTACCDSFRYGSSNHHLDRHDPCLPSLPCSTTADPSQPPVPTPSFAARADAIFSSFTSSGLPPPQPPVTAFAAQPAAPRQPPWPQQAPVQPQPLQQVLPGRQPQGDGAAVPMGAVPPSRAPAPQPTVCRESGAVGWEMRGGVSRFFIGGRGECTREPKGSSYAVLHPPVLALSRIASPRTFFPAAFRSGRPTRAAAPASPSRHRTPAPTTDRPTPLPRLSLPTRPTRHSSRFWPCLGPRHNHYNCCYGAQGTRSDDRHHRRRRRAPARLVRATRGRDRVGRHRQWESHSRRRNYECRAADPSHASD